MGDRLAMIGLTLKGDLRPRCESEIGVATGGWFFDFTVDQSHGQIDMTKMRLVRQPMRSATGVSIDMRFCVELCAKHNLCKKCHEFENLCVCATTQGVQGIPAHRRRLNQAAALHRIRQSQGGGQRPAQARRLN